MAQQLAVLNGSLTNGSTSSRSAESISSAGWSDSVESRSVQVHPSPTAIERYDGKHEMLTRGVDAE